MSRGAGTRLAVMSRARAERFSSGAPYAMISIGDPGEPRAFGADPLRVGLLRIDAIDFPDGREGCFTDAHADEALDFAGAHVARGVPTLVVHCRLGRSRSRGVALGIALAFGLPSHRHTRAGWPNPLVVRRILDAHERRTGRRVPMPVVARDLVRCPLHPGGYNPPRRDARGEVVGFCAGCGKDVRGERLDVFALWARTHPDLAR